MNTTNAMKKKSIEIVDDDFMVCADCLSAIVNDDYTGLDMRKDADEREVIIREGITKAGGYIVSGDQNNDIGFTNYQCDCCGTKLAGERHHCIVYGEPNKKTFSHAYDIAFEVNHSSTPDGGEVTAAQLRKAIISRINNISDEELVNEAVGGPYDSIEMDERGDVSKSAVVPLAEGGMYLVRWVIDAEADNAVEAARGAFRMVTADNTTACVFDVMDKFGRNGSIDLLDHSTQDAL